MLYLRYFTLILVLAVSVKNSLGQQATDNSVQIDELLKLAESPAPFVALEKGRIAESKQKLQAAMSELDRQLMRHGEGHASAWKDYLNWSDLQAQMESESPDRKVLSELARRFLMNHAGLELKVFTDVRQSILDYANALYYGTGTIAKRTYDSRLKIIKSALAKLKESHDEYTLGLLSEAATDLENSGNCPELVAGIRATFSKPNFHFEVSESFAKAILKDVNAVDTRPLCEEILGVLQRGTAITQTKFDVDFLPSRNSARFKIYIDGDTTSEQVGTKDLGLLGSVYICSEGNTCLVGEAIIDFDGKQMSYSNLAAGARTNTHIKGVDTPPLLRSITLNQIENQKSQGEREAAAKARSKFVAQIRTQLKDTLAKTNTRLKDGVRATTRRLDFEPKRFEASTSDDHFRVLAIVGNKKHLSSLQGPSSNIKGDVVTQLHESAINNGLQHLLGGRKVSMDDLRELIASFGVELPPKEEDEKPLTIEFPRARPIQVRFDDQKVTTVVTARQIQSGGTVVKDKLRITITYSVKSTENSITVESVGEPAIDFDVKNYTNSHGIIESVMKPKLDKLFKGKSETIRIDELKLPPELKSVGLPKISRLELKGGWLISELNMKSTNVAKSVPIKKLSKAVVVPIYRSVPVKPLREVSVNTAYISDASFRVYDR